MIVATSASSPGSPTAEIAAAAAAARRRAGSKGKWVIALQNTTQQPVLRLPHEPRARASGSSRRRWTARRARRRQRHARDRSSGSRSSAPSARSCSAIPTHAAYVLDDQMAKTPERADQAPDRHGARGRPPRRSARPTGCRSSSTRRRAASSSQPWDWSYYAEKVRKAKYDLDEAQIKPYFELNRVLEDGVFYAAHELYGTDVQGAHTTCPSTSPTCACSRCSTRTARRSALFYCDYFKRDNKSGGAWMDSFVDQSELLGTKPVDRSTSATSPKPAPGQPALLTFDDVTTMFHEFGHALHGMFSNVKYPTSPARTCRATSSSSRRSSTSTGRSTRPCSPTTRSTTRPARRCRRGAGREDQEDAAPSTRATRRPSTSAPRCSTWRGTRCPRRAASQDVDTFEAAALERTTSTMPQVPPRYRTTYFSHIWDDGYSAGYYAYLWSEVLDDDVLPWFKEHGGLTRENGQRFRDMILSRGGTEDVADTVPRVPRPRPERRAAARGARPGRDAVHASTASVGRRFP